jgi:hypothetical protein
MNEKGQSLTPEQKRFLFEAVYVVDDGTDADVTKSGAELTREEIERALAQAETVMHKVLDELKQYMHLYIAKFDEPPPPEYEPNRLFQRLWTGERPRIEEAAVEGQP